ncbi:Helix-turn-helix [Nocardioides scoriae]|uniref:Helix-turn-helix n=1 Tax=Nocardioides scoriae TaxID=642780 RepID=A0A1H1VII5_9ACTN|nr:helix-turn-helix domain-containing protein [Nocardioides scoriae]SDS83879.1 Helix-turn-helix [Nocardioides scoriae]
MNALGLQIAVARRELGWTAAELASRLGVTKQTVLRIENGSPNTAIGTALEAAVLCGIALFGPDPHDSARVADQERARLALLPARVRLNTPELDNDF